MWRISNILQFPITMMLLWALDDVHSAVYKSDDYYKGLFDGTGQFVPWDDYYHYPNQILNWPEKQNPKPLDPYINGTSTRVPLPTYTPDWRAPEPPYIAKNEYFKEEGRYYRIQSSNIYNWNNYRSWESPGKMMCYCVTVYKKYTPLAMGAVLTYRNMLTTALSTDMVVSKYRNRKTLHNILGAWYNSDSYGMKDVTNSVYYLTPARIHYHPKWNPPEMVNRSHPIPSVYDLALWTTTKSMYYDRAFIKRAEAGFADAQHRGYRTMLCDRWSNIQGRSLMPDYGTDLVFIVGCQMIMDIGRFPYPWFKYAMRFHGGNGKLNPCPKTDWDWFLCVECYGPNMRFGAEPGAALHVAAPSGTWRYSGLAGLNSFAMKLRSKKFVNYFTLLDRHPVLDWLHDAMKARVPHAWLDFRFESIKDTPIRVRVAGGTVVDQGHEPPGEWGQCKVYLKKNHNLYVTPNYKPIWFK